ncbi:CBS domain-containing protein [Candidatus Halobonum tyrrellensis]|uniref:Zinc metalloprotease n=1 Tax=Candidatus Halobonum tyrrellensis G22 TaxID=1324957 RepID=V4HET6_9EURY|nr:CBS domain-containing protein [Candidatus Halobonum tyrrellensis]ESP88623.1 zn-dependent protease [Candidatus Halobonum tyrrellensis G22]
MRGITLGRVAGIPVQLNWTFLLVLPLFAWLISQQVGQFVEILGLFGVSLDADALTAGSLPLALGVAAAVGLFVSVLLHEFGHSLTAMHYGYDIDSITLWLFGGVASFEELPEDWKQELVIAIAGPAVSFALGVLAFVALGFPLPPSATFVVGYLGVMNVVLGGFNLLPGFPMDGGRVLRALLARNRTHARATQLAAEVGKVFAFLLGLYGLLSGDFLTIGLAFFIYIAGAGEAQQTVLKAAFEGVIVGDIMTPRSELVTVDPDTSVADLLARMFSDRHTGYPVIDRGSLVGMVTLEDAQGVREVERDAYTVADVMATDIASVTPDADAIDALELMQERGVGRLAVIDAEGDLVGLVSRTDLMTAFNVIQSGGTAPSLGGLRGDDALPTLDGR